MSAAAHPTTSPPMSQMLSLNHIWCSSLGVAHPITQLKSKSRRVSVRVERTKESYPLDTNAQKFQASAAHFATYDIILSHCMQQ